MRRKLTFDLPRVSMPLWFRATFTVLFALLLAAYFLVRGETAGGAFAGRTSPEMLAGADPRMRLDAGLARRGLPRRGGYRMNGMRVQFNTVPSSDPVGQMAETEAALHKTGYRVRRATVAGEETLFGFHPETSVFVSVAMTTLPPGIPALRLTQRDLGELSADFVAELPGIPAPADAQAKTLISPIDGVGPDTLTFFTQSTPEQLRDLYARSLTARGWQQLAPPIDPSGKLATLFFAKDDQECSIIVVADSGLLGNAVWITLGPPAGT
jgi:hypothetical protein